MDRRHPLAHPSEILGHEIGMTLRTTKRYGSLCSHPLQLL
jgi:hypothetical protein